MAKRNEWTFEFTAGEVQVAADAKAKHHREREEFWKSQLGRAEEDLRSNGIELREMPITGGTRLQPMFDPQRSARVEECRQKREEHRKKAEEYEAYSHALGIAGRRGLNVQLDVSDILFFDL